MGQGKNGNGRADKSAVDSWVTYRPQIKVFDCTVRDGGLINNHRFDDAFVRRIYDTCVAAGVDYMELGYKADRKIFVPAEHGAWKFCAEDDLRRVVGDNATSLKLSVMADAERTDYHNDILPRDKSVLNCIRIATYVHQIPTAVDMLKDAHDKGYETTLNLMAVSTVQDRELADALVVLARAPVDTVYVVDSFGSLYSEQIRDLVQKFLKALEGTGKNVGFHGHNNQQLAYANTIEALILGATWLDATIHGLGRGAGNCPLELLLGFLKNPKFHLRPVLQCVQDVFVPLRQKIDWGYSIPYMITGQLNQHPRTAIKVREGKTPDDYVGFYDQTIEEE
ncbi:MAG: aldolase catalytic domain-containing protein [Planctomycetota bacterium]|nr:aldolase catalytic domain-containing protein [Planctomycetota bacterium]